MLQPGNSVGGSASDGRGSGHRRVGELLVESGALRPEQLAAALDRQRFLAARRRNNSIGRILVSLGYVSSDQLNAALARQAAQGTADRASEAGGGSGSWEVSTHTGPVRPISALGVLDGLAEKVATGDMETMSAVPLGFDPLDEALGGGVRPGELILLGGGQGVGKTTMALQMARNVASSGQANCLYICYEHDEENITQRLISMESVDPYAQDFRLGVTVRDLTQRIVAAHRRGNVALFDILDADPRTGMAIQRLRQYGDRLHLLKGSAARTTLGAISDLVEAYRVRSDERLVLFVDYLQKVPVLPDPPTDKERIEAVVSGLKELAMGQEIPVISVVASDLDGLQAKRMRAHHFLGGSLLAYEADVILMLADKYDAVARVHIEFNPQKAQGFHDWVVCSIEKNRSGRDVIDMQFEKRFSYSCMDPNGSYVTEKLIDERTYVE